MSETELNEIWARWERSTAGEWVNLYTPDSVGPVVSYQWDGEEGSDDKQVVICATPELDDREADFDFIAHVHQDVFRLKGHIDTLEAWIEQLTAENQRLQRAQSLANMGGTRLPRSNE